MEIKFIGSKSEIESEMRDFLGIEVIEAGKPAGGSKGTLKGTTKAKVEKITLDLIREAMLACDDKDGKKNLLADYDAAKLSELAEDKYEEFYADLKKL